MNSIAQIQTTPATIVLPRNSARAGVDPSLTRWSLGLAIGSLLVAGCFSLLLVVGRLPMFSPWITDPLFFKRCLVLHVDLALIVWFFSFAVGLYSLLPGDRCSNGQFRAGLYVATTGGVAMIAGTMIPGTAPVLANYVPVIDNAVYVAGLAMFFLGLTVSFISDRLFLRPKQVDSTTCFNVPPDAAVGLKAVAVVYVLAVTTFLISAAATPRILDPKSYYELVFWGGGHVLQVANVAAMLAVWLCLLGSIMKRPVLKTSTARVLFALLLAPHFIAPLLTMNGTTGGLYRQGFTRLMQFGIAPVSVVILGLCIVEIKRAYKSGALKKSDLRSPPFVGFVSSAALTITGFLLGSSIRNSNTMIPAHYHASIGAVTVAFMAITYQLLPGLGFLLKTPRLMRLIPLQLPLFGFGQVIFAVGFAFGGMHGLSRKAYGAEQHIRTAGEMTGLLIMGAGGLVAVAGGLLFLFLMLCAAWSRFNRPFQKFRPIHFIARTNP
jgi:cytochrome c oxidase subunit I